MAMLDCISGGRFVGGFPVGTSMDTNFAYGQTPLTLREKYREGHDLIIKAWTEPEPFAFNGKYNQLRYVNIWPRLDSKAASAGVDPWRWQRRDLGLGGCARRICTPS